MYSKKWRRWVVSFKVVSRALSVVGEELSKRQSVLFHWRPFSSKQNDIVQLFYRGLKFKTTMNLLDVSLKRVVEFFFHFEGVLLVVSGYTCVLRGCSRTLKTPNSPPPLPVPYIISTQLLPKNGKVGTNVSQNREKGQQCNRWRSQGSLGLQDVFGSRTIKQNGSKARPKLRR